MCVCMCPLVCVYFRAVKVNALIYEIIVAEINALKYFNAVNATLTKPPRACSQLNRRDRDGSRRCREQKDCWAKSFCLRGKMTETIDKTKVVCSICQAEFSYHRSSSSLSYHYHLNAKHPTESRSA